MQGQIAEARKGGNAPLCGTVRCVVLSMRKCGNARSGVRTCTKKAPLPGPALWLGKEVEKCLIVVVVLIVLVAVFGVFGLLFLGEDGTVCGGDHVIELDAVGT